MTDRVFPEDDDAALSALLDGALPAEEAATLRRRLQEEPALARRHDELRQVDEALRHTYAGIADEPLPRRVVQLLRPPTRRRWLAVPIAAGVGLAAGLLLAFLVLPSAHPLDPPGFRLEGGVVEKGSALETVLETAPSGESRVLGRAWSATPRLTFRSHEGDPCRRVDLRGDAGILDALACRHDRAWRVELVGLAAKSPVPGGVYRPAAGGSPSPIDVAIGTMAAGPPLGREAERAWISRGFEGPVDR